jgi:hypothetical protein
MASSIFGGIAGAISGPPKVKRISYSSQLDDQINQLTGAQSGTRSANAADVARIGAQAGKAATQMEQLNPEDMATIQSIIGGRVDPFQTYQNVGNYQFGLLDRLASNLAEQGRAGESRRLASMGYGGRGGSTYQSNTLLDRISRNLSPVYASTLGNIGRDATAIEGSRLGQNANIVDLIRERAGIPARSLGLYQVPLQTRMAVNDAEIASLLGLGEAVRTNTAGFQERPTALSQIASSLDSIVDTGMDLYSGGMLGGILGGGGGGGRSPAATPPFRPANFGPSGFSGFNMSYTGGPLTPQPGPSGFGNFGMSYGWTPPWRG